jgi:hypothetical protein
MKDHLQYSSSLFSFLLLSFLMFHLTPGCASSPYPGAGAAESAFDDIADCHQKYGKEGFNKHCRYEYASTQMKVQVDSVQTLGVNYLSIFAEAGTPKKRIHCQVKGSTFRGQAEALRQKDVVTIVGTAEEVTFDNDNAFIVFDECELLGPRPE